MRTSYLKIVLVSTFVVLNMVSPATATKSSNATVKGVCTERGCGTSVYNHAKRNSKRVGWLADGTKVRVVCERNNWARIGKNRYVPVSRLVLKEQIFSCDETGPVQDD